MALPMLFAACSQDELVDNYDVQKGPDAEGFYATLNPTLGVDSRATWLGGRLGWDSTDKISVYWLGANPTIDGNTNNAKYQFNSVFKTEDGNTFESESMVFVGGNVAVYPANLADYKGGDIVLTVPAVQDANTIKNIPYISNYLNIQSRDYQTDNNPGYNNGIDAPLKMAANVFNLTFELKNTAGLAAYDFAVESVELHATSAFATEAKIFTSDRNVYDASGSELVTTESDKPFYGSEQEYKEGNTWKKINTIDKNLWVTANADKKVDMLKTTAITDNGNGTYTAQFVILPTDANVATGAKIVINTTCGHVDIETPKDNPATSVNETLIVTGAAGVVTLEACFDAIVDADHVAYSENSASMFMGEKTGRVFPRSIVADMNNATLDDSYVYSSADIIRYVNIYNKMGKENTSDKEMNLILSSNVANNTTFAGLTKAALAAVDGENNYSLGISGYKNVTLSAGNVDAVQISDAGAVYDIKALAGEKKVELVLAAGEWTMDDVLDLNENITKVCNKGTLTVNGTTNARTYAQESLKETICNEGTLKIGGNGILQVPGNLTTAWGSTTEVATGQNLIFTEDITSGLNGTFNVNAADAFMTTKEGKKVTNEGIINNWGTVAAEGDQTANGFINKESYAKIGNTEYSGGIINVKGAQAITYVYDNAEGTINMLTREDEIMVASEIQGQIVYPYTAADGSTFQYTIYDRFNTVKFGSDVPTLTLAEVITDTENSKYDETLLPFDNISFIFDGTTTLKSAATKNFAINNLTVNKNANLRVTTGNKLIVNDLTNKGTITIGGYIYYKNNYVSGRLLSQGGAIKKYEGESYAEVLVNAAIEAAAENGEAVINLDRDITLDAPMVFEALESRTTGGEITITLNLNGYSIVNNTAVKGALGQDENVTAAAAIYVNNSNLTLIINGDDNTVVSVDAEAHYQSAVWVRNGNVEINGGNFYVGKDDEGKGCTTIQGYANDKNKSYIRINGGKFSCEPESDGFSYKQYACLNLTGGEVENASTYIQVAGGEFYCFNPANNCSEGEYTNFVVEGKKVYVESTGKEASGNFIVGTYDEGWYVVK